MTFFPLLPLLIILDLKLIMYSKEIKGLLLQAVKIFYYLAHSKKMLNSKKLYSGINKKTVMQMKKFQYQW